LLDDAGGAHRAAAAKRANMPPPEVGVERLIDRAIGVGLPLVVRCARVEPDRDERARQHQRDDDKFLHAAIMTRRNPQSAIRNVLSFSS